LLGVVTAHGRKLRELLVVANMFFHLRNSNFYCKFVKAYGCIYSIVYLIGKKGKEIIINYDGKVRGKVCMMENERKKKEIEISVRLDDYTVPNTR
jgi:hypothetical protein